MRRQPQEARGSARKSSGNGATKSRSSRFAMNPAFASAHGIQTQSSTSKSRTSTNNRRRFSHDTKNETVAVSSTRRMEQAVKTARSTGKLNLSNAGLSYPLPDAIFDLRSGIQVDLSFDSSSNTSYGCIGEEGVTLLDLSDNDLGGEQKAKNDETEGETTNGDANGGGCLDERIEKFKALKILRLKRCNLSLSHLPLSSIQILESLTILDLASNALKGNFPLEFVPWSLKELDVSSNQITALTLEDTTEVYLPNLTHLNVTKNNLVTLPSSLQCSNLDTLQFGQNQISELPSSIIQSSMRSISTIEGCENQISTIPDKISSCGKLRILDLSQNELTNVPTIHSSLVRLNLNQNKITSVSNLFSKEIMIEQKKDGQIFKSDLVELKLRQNKLSTLDADIMTSLHALTILDAGENELKDVPYVLGYLPQLRKIALDGNPLRVIRPSLAEDMDALKKSLRRRGDAPVGLGGSLDEVESKTNSNIDKRRERSAGISNAKRSMNTEARDIVMAALGGSNTLKLDNKQYTSLPQDILQELLATDTSCNNDENGGSTFGHRIKVLSVSKNLLRNIDVKWMDALPRLNTINASFNRLEELPINLGSIPLSTLLLERNSLAAASIASSALCGKGGKDCMLAQSLTHLDLSYNAIEYIPEDLMDLPVLSTLILSNNQVSTLANGKGCGWKPGLPSLTHLDLSSNQINDLGDFPVILGGCCPKLQSLKLNNNELKFIPGSLGLLSSLNHIDLRGNPQRAVRGAVLERTCESILMYLRNKMDEDEIKRVKEHQNRAGALISKNIVDNSTSSVEPTENHGVNNIKSDNCSAKNKGNDTAATQQASQLASPLVESLREEIDDLTIQLNNVHLTEAKKYAMKKKLAMQKAKLIREERRLRTEAK